MKSSTFNNNRALFDYKIIDRMEVGVILKGWEVKAIRSGRMSLRGGWVSVRNNKWYWHNEIIPTETYISQHEKSDKREIIMSANQSKKWAEKIKQRGLTAVPIKGYFRGRWFKLELGLASGKNKVDKKESIKKKDLNILLHRDIKK